MARTRRILGTLLHSELLIRLTRNEAFMETLARAMAMSIEWRRLIDERIRALIQQRSSEDIARIAALEQQVAELVARLERIEVAAE